MAKTIGIMTVGIRTKNIFTNLPLKINKEIQIKKSKDNIGSITLPELNYPLTIYFKKNKAFFGKISHIRIFKKNNKIKANMYLIKNCEFCGKLLTLQQMRCCSRRCDELLWKKENPEKHKQKLIRQTIKKKTNKKYKEYVKQYNKKYYQENKQKFDKYNKKDYQKNKQKWQEKNFVKYNRKEILKIIGTVCQKCGKFPSQIHHTTYENLPHNNLKEYCKFLKILCTKCHKKKNPLQNKN